MPDAKQPETFATLIDQARRNPDSREAVSRLIQGLGQAFKAAKDDPAKIEQTADQMSSQASAIIDAIMARLPATGDQPSPAAAGAAGVPAHATTEKYGSVATSGTASTEKTTEKHSTSKSK